jgi:type I restriction enzyme, S subunit
MNHIDTIITTIGNIASEDKQIVFPNAPESKNLPYLGLENIETQTGKILGYETDSVQIKSNTFAFSDAHVLFGKLRPYLNKVALPDQKGRCTTEIIPLLPHGIDRKYLSFLLRTQKIIDAVMLEKTGSRMPRANMNILFNIEVSIPKSIEKQRRIAARLNSHLTEVEKARQAIETQLQETEKLANAIIFNSINSCKPQTLPLGKVLDEIKQGIGENWADFTVLGATKDGLAPAKSPPGKKPERYKPVFPGTVFYNPMRILIGSIAFVDQDDTPGITSPDYVVLKGKPGIVDSRWFYYWLRSPLGEHCILSLARGAVRERMLFSRLSKGNIELPDFKVQQDAAAALAELKPLCRTLERQRDEITQLPQKILAQAFEIET